MKRITKLPFLFYTHPKSYYEIPQDFIKFEDMPSIPKPSHVPPTSTRCSEATRLQEEVAGSCACVNRSERYNEA